jgi:hypothetical protein
MLLESTGEYKQFVATSPMNGFKVDCIAPFQRGFVISGDNGKFIVYERTEDVMTPYRRSNMEVDLGNNQALSVGGSIVNSMAIASTEDMIIFVTETG